MFSCTADSAVNQTCLCLGCERRNMQTAALLFLHHNKDDWKWPDKPIRIKWCEVSAEFKVSGGPQRWQSDPVTASCLLLNVGVFVLSRQISQRSGLSAGLETLTSTLNSTCLLRTNSSVSVNAFGSFRWWRAAQAESTSSWFRISWRLKSSDVHLRLLQQSREQVSSLRRSLDLKSVRI